MKKRAAIALQYRVKLIGPDGAEWEWRITDCYFLRRLKKIGQEMLEMIRAHDLTYEFGLKEPMPDRLSHLVHLKVNLGEEDDDNT